MQGYEVRELQAIVVGAGIGGLAAAASLARAGVQVDVFERAAHLGGKLRQDIVLGRSIDAGPTVLTMRWQLERVFRAAGTTLERELTLERIDPLARHFFADGSMLDLFADIDASVDAVRRLSGPAEAAAYRRFAQQGAKLFELVEQPFLRGSRPGLGSLFTGLLQRGPGELIAMSGHRTMRAVIDETFRDERLRALFSRFATYVGSSPFSAPATLNVIAHIERLGVWSVSGGLGEVPRALSRAAERHGARIHLGCEVTEVIVSEGRARGVRLMNGGTLLANAVVFNGDVSALSSGLLGDAVRDSAPETKRPSYSAVTVSAVATLSGPALVRHNVFFPGDGALEFQELERGELPSEPSVYLAAQDRVDRDPALDSERLFFITNAPAGCTALAGEAERQRWVERLVARLQQRFGVSIAMKAFTVTTPSDFAKRFPGTGGAIYGPMSYGMTSPLRRASERSRLSGLFLAGGSTHPGAGVPMAAQSGLLAAQAVLTDLASTSPSKMTATHGGTSMS